MKDFIKRIGLILFQRRSLTFPLVILATYYLIPPASPILGEHSLERLRGLITVATIVTGLALRALVLNLAVDDSGQAHGAETG